MKFKLCFKSLITFKTVQKQNVFTHYINYLLYKINNTRLYKVALSTMKL